MSLAIEQDLRASRSLAEDATRRHAWVEAAALWRALAAAEPGLAEAPQRLAEALFFLHRHEEAIEAARRAAALAPQDIRPLVVLARAQTGRGTPAAAAAWEAVLQRNPEDFEAWARLAQARMQTAESGRALAALLRALALRPDHPFGLGLAATLLRGLPAGERQVRLREAAAADTDAGLVLLQVAVQLEPGDPLAAELLAARLLARNAHAEAASVLEAVVGPTPGFDRASLLLLRLMQMQGEAEAALRRYAEAIAGGMPPDPDTTAREVGLRLGLMLLGHDRLAEAAALIEPAHGADPADRLGIRAMLKLLLTRGAKADAQALAARVLDAHRMASWAWCEVILAFAGSEQAELAAAAFEEASTLFRDQPAVWLDIAEAAGQARLGHAIRKTLPDLVFDAPADRLRASRLALSAGVPDLAARLLGEGEPDQSLAEEWEHHKASLARARELLGPRVDAGLTVPDAEPGTLPGEAERAIARGAIETRDWAAAVTAWEAVLAALPMDAEALLGMGQVRFRQGRMAEARAAFARALRLAPGEEPLRWLARSLRALGEEREALALWEQLLEAEPRDLEAWLRSAEAHARLGDLPAALAATEKAQRQLGSNDQLLRLQARLQAEAGHLDAASRHWAALTEANLADSEAQFRLGQLARQLGDDAQAERRLRAALAAPRPVLRAAGVLARLLSSTGRMREARSVLRVALRRVPAEPEFWQTAFEWLRAGARHAVIGRYLRALERRAGTDPQALLRLAERMVIAESPDCAVAVLHGLLDRPEVAPAAAERLARLLLHRGEVDAAIPLIRAPGLPPALRAEVAAAARIAGRMRAETDEAEPMAGFATLVARSARRRVYPRYLPKPGSMLHVIDSLALGGEGRQCSAMARAQAATGQEVMVLRTDPGRAGHATFFLPDLAAAGIASGTVADHAEGVARALAALPDLALPTGGFAEALRPWQVGGLAAAIRGLRPESIVVWSPHCMADAALAAMALGVPRIVMRSGSVAPSLRGGLTEAESARHQLWRATLRALLLEGGGVMLNNSAANLAGWTDWLGLPEAVAEARCGVLPNIVDAATLQPGAPAAVAALRDRLGIPGGVPVVGSVMRLEQEKGLDLWLGILRSMRALRPDAVFLVLGDGRLGEALRARLAAEGLAGAVRLAGRVGDELPLQYSLMDALLLTSSVEGLPNAVLEAQCFGLPLVAPRLGGLAEAIAPDEADHALLASRDPAEWCAALAAALAAPERRAERLARGRRFITGRFAAPAVLARLDRYLAIAGAVA